MVHLVHLVHLVPLPARQLAVVTRDATLDGLMSM